MGAESWEKREGKQNLQRQDILEFWNKHKAMPIRPNLFQVFALSENDCLFSRLG